MSPYKLVHAVAIAAISAGSLIPISSAASAHDWNRDGGRGDFESVQRGHSFNRWHDPRLNRWQYRQDYTDYSHRRHRDHAGRAIAIGTFAAILGLALAAQSSRVQHDYYDNDE